MSKRQPEGAVQAAPQEGARGAAGPTLTGKVVLITGASSGIGRAMALACAEAGADLDRKSTRLNSSHDQISYAVFCLKKKKKNKPHGQLSNSAWSDVTDWATA